MFSVLSCFTLISEYLEDHIISWEVFMIIKDFMTDFKALIRDVVDKSLLNINK